MTKLIGIGTFKNCVMLGYPFIEAILSVLPICDKLLLNDGGSQDNTLIYLNHLQNLYPDKITLFNFPWGGENCEKQFDNSLNQLMEKVRNRWVIEIQGDELFNEKDVFPLLSQTELLDKLGYNSIRHLCLSCSDWTKFDNYQYWHVRIFNNLDDIVSSEWGDCFYRKGQNQVNEQFTSHDVSPEFCTSIPCYHIHRLFPENQKQADIAMAIQNAAGDPPRIKVAKQWEERENFDYILPKKEKVLSNLPALVSDLWSYKKYSVREELFSKEWLVAKTGLRVYSL